jgi:hypothetical protein
MNPSNPLGVYTLEDFKNPMNSDEARTDYLRTLTEGIHYNPASYVPGHLDIVAAGLQSNDFDVFSSACETVSAIARNAEIFDHISQSKLGSIALELEGFLRPNIGIDYRAFAATALGDILESVPQSADTAVPRSHQIVNNIVKPATGAAIAAATGGYLLLLLLSNENIFHTLFPVKARETLIESLIVAAIGAHDKELYLGGKYKYPSREAIMVLEKALRAAPKHLDTARRIIAEEKRGFTKKEEVRQLVETISEHRLRLMSECEVDALLNGTSINTETQALPPAAPSPAIPLTAAEIAPTPPAAQSTAAQLEAGEDIISLMLRANAEVLRRSDALVQQGKGNPGIDATIVTASANLIKLVEIPDAVRSQLRGNTPPNNLTP